MTVELIIILILAMALLVLLYKNYAINSDINQADMSEKISSKISNEITKNFQQGFTQNNKNLTDTMHSHIGLLTQQLQGINGNTQNTLTKNATDSRGELSTSLKTLQDNLGRDIGELTGAVKTQLTDIRQDNNQQLQEMRKTVDEKLQKTLENRLSQSFQQVQDLLSKVHKDMGEMRNLATNVGDLQKVLSNVKTRGISGEYALAAILEQILSPEQYEANVATIEGSRANVEYAIKLPGSSGKDEKHIWLPIDSKFPLDTYNHLIDACETNQADLIKSSTKTLLKTIENYAKDISDKYVEVPYTTNFGIMFLPIESLYAEVLRNPDIFNKLQRQNIVIAGPATLAALLNSLQMGFRTLVIEKRSSEVWGVLSQVKDEFNTFADALGKVRKQLDTATNSLETLQTTRSNVMQRKLSKVTTATNKSLADNSDELNLLN